MGKVWRAHDEVLHRTVAVKELTAGLYVAEADRIVLHARTQKEARAAARISHPGVVTVHDVIEYDDRPWIVMQYVDGPSLADAAKESGEIAPREAARIGIHVLGALRAAHEAGVLHRDVKPGNVLLARDGRVLLTDFGIAAIEGDSTITRTGELVGSIDYLAPERVRGGDPGPASDLWSLGATLYTAVEGRSPFRRTSPISTMQAVVAEEPPPPGRAGPLGGVITALLRKDPDERPSAAETERMLLEAMEGREPRSAQAYVPTQRVSGELLRTAGPDAAFDGGGTASGTAHLPHHPYPPTGSPAVRRSRGRWRRTVLVIAAAALIGVGAGVAALQYANRAEGSVELNRTGAHASRGPSSTAPVAPSPSKKVQGAGVPDGWHRVNDPEGFSLVVPDGWVRQVRPADGDRVDYVDYTPDNGVHYIRISIDPEPDFENSYAHMLNLEKQLSERLPGYDRRALHSNSFRDHAGSLWEFVWNETKDHPGARHAIDQMYYGEQGGPEYALYMTGPEADWDTTRDQFATMLRGWKPSGDAD